MDYNGHSPCAVKPEALGIYGASAGGHLPLMIGTTGGPGNPEAEDPIERESSRVQAVVQFYGPTDFFNYGAPGELGLGAGRLADLKAAFDFQYFDEEERVFHSIKDPETIERIGREISPVYQVTPETPPTLCIHGDADVRVPLQQSELIIAKLRENGVPCELVIKPGAEHSCPDMCPESRLVAEWFRKYLGTAE